MTVITKIISPIIALNAIDEYVFARALTLEEVDTEARLNEPKYTTASLSLSHVSSSQKDYLEMSNRNMIGAISHLIATQASTAMLAQANQSKQYVLSLLR